MPNGHVIAAAMEVYSLPKKQGSKGYVMGREDEEYMKRIRQDLLGNSEGRDYLRSSILPHQMYHGPPSEVLYSRRADKSQTYSQD